MLQSLRRAPLPWLLALAYLIVGLAYSAANPLHEATDELRHFRYVRYIADLGQLPVQSAGAGNAQAHHPPLYYASAALLTFWARPPDPLYEPAINPHWSFRNWEIGADNKNQYLHGPDEAWPWRGAALAAHAARIVTLLWGAGAVALTALLARRLLPDQPAAALAAGALIALCPMFLYLGGAANNDVPAGLIGAALTYVCLISLQDGLTLRRAGVLGLLYGLALLTKFNLLAMGGALAYTLIAAPLSAGEKRLPQVVKHGALIAGLTLLVGGWWYVRNTILYGEPTGFLRVTEIWGFRQPSESFSLAWRELGYAWTSLWARFGYGQIPVHQAWYIAMAAVCGAGLIGFARLSIRDDRLRGAAGLLMLVCLLNFAVLYAYITVSPAGAMGRFLFPGLPAFAVMVGAGLSALLPRPWPSVAAGALSVGMAAFALSGLLIYLMPAYALPAQAAIPSDPLNVTFGEHVRLLAIETTPTEATPGGQIDVRVTWQVIAPTPVPYQVFIHLINEQGALIAQRDTFTGLGNYPSHFWRPGHVFTETYRVFLPETAYRPDQAHIRLGLWHPELGRLPISGAPASDSALTAGQISLPADPTAAFPNALNINFGDAFTLRGYSIEPRVAQPGQDVQVTLYWQALRPPQDQDYKVFLQMIQPPEARWASNDGPPVAWDVSTRAWEAGQVYVDVRVLRMAPDVPPGFYDLHVGWFGSADGQRLNILAEDGRVLDSYLRLSGLAVRAQ